MTSQPPKPAASPSPVVSIAPRPEPKPAIEKSVTGTIKTKLRHPVALPAMARMRHKTLAAAFGVMVAVPTIATAAYLYLFAADQYGSRVGFTVRTEDISSAVDLLGGLGKSLGGGGGTSDTDVLYEFIQSQELVAAVDARLDLRQMWSRQNSGDLLLGFGASGTIEDLTRYWQDMVQISYDAASGLMEVRTLAFSPEDATAINEAMYEESTNLVNSLSAVAREDATRYAREDLDRSLERLKTAREALTSFRLQNQIVDVNADIQGQMGLLGTMQAQLAEALIENDIVVQTAPQNDPRLQQYARRIQVIEARIAQERSKFGGPNASEGAENYAIVVSDFERLSVDREFAERAYIASMAAYDGAVAEANRKSRYLATYIRPTNAEKSEFPQRGMAVGLVLLFSFLGWSILSLVYYSLRDRH